MRRITSLGTVVVALGILGCGSSGSKSGTGGAGGNGAGSDAGLGGAGSAGGSTGAGGSATGADGAVTAGFSLSTVPATVMLAPGGSQNITVNIDRSLGSTTFTDSIALTLQPPAGLDGWFMSTFTPTPATASSSLLALSVVSAADPGTYTCYVVGTSGATTVTLPLTVTVSVAPPATTLLVDGDYSDNNDDPTDPTIAPSASDTLFSTLLQTECIAFNTFVVPTPDGGATASAPAAADLTGYSTIIWYTGAVYGGPVTLSSAQQAVLKTWLDAGGHTLLIFSEDLISDIGVNDWSSPETNVFLKSYVGAAEDTSDGDAVFDATYNATGAAGTPFANDVFVVSASAAISNTADVINPASGTDTLVTLMEDPLLADGTPIAVAVTVGRKSVGTAGTSQVVYVGLPIENIVPIPAPNKTNADFFHAVLSYAGLTTP